MLQRHQIQLGAFPPGEFHRRDEIAISADQDDYLSDLLEGQRGDVQANPHVYALLLDQRLQPFMINLDRSRRLEQARLNFPAGKRQLAHPQRHIVELGQLLLQGVVLFSAGSRSEVHMITAERLLGLVGQRRSVVIVDTVEAMSGQRRVIAQHPDERIESRRIHRAGHVAELAFDKAAVDQDCVADRHDGTGYEEGGGLGQAGRLSHLDGSPPSADFYFKAGVG
mgnify:CR=1 FL=1